MRALPHKMGRWGFAYISRVSALGGALILPCEGEGGRLSFIEMG
jgi:hypothetical protein